MNLFKKLFSTDILDRIPHSLSDNSEGRKERMRELLELLPMQLLVKIETIEDCEGVLIVTWKHSPTESHRALIDIIWDGIFAQGVNATRHEGKPPMRARTNAQVWIHDSRVSALCNNK